MATTDKTTATPRGLIALPQSAAPALIAIGAVGTIASTFMPWTYTSEFPGDLTYYGSPAGLQILALVAGVLTLLYALTRWNVRGLNWLNPAGATAPIALAATSAFAVSWFTVIAIAIDLKGLVALDPGAYIAAIASLVALLGALALPQPGDTAKSYFTKPENIPAANSLPGWVERVVISAATALALLVFAAILPLVGFWLSAALLYIAVAVLLGAPRTAWLAITGAILSGVIVLLFDRIIGLTLPAGPWGF
jgi:branched-chain amino acid transport system permease protein